MDLVKDARVLAISKKIPPKILFEISEKKAIELCDFFPAANKEIVLAGVYLMDLMLSEAVAENRISEHVQMSVEGTRKFLKKYNIPEEDKDKIINCVEAHHGKVEFECIEAEICANADCYRFIHPKGFFYYLMMLGKRGGEFEDCLNQSEYKLDEKNKTLSLKYCKEELTDYYEILKKYIKEARNF